MRLFADSDFLVGLNCPSDSRAREAEPLWNLLLSHEVVKGLEDLVISNLVLVEALQLITKKAGCIKAASFWTQIVEKSTVRWADRDAIQKAIEEKLLWRSGKSGEAPIGLTDAVSLVFMDKMRIRRIISFDEGYDKYPLYRRIYNENSLLELRRSLGHID